MLIEIDFTINIQILLHPLHIICVYGYV